MFRVPTAILLALFCISARADLVNFVESTDLPDLVSGITDTFVLDAPGVNQWTGTISGYEIPSGALDFDDFNVEVAPGIVITDVDLTTSNVTSNGFANFAQIANLLAPVTFAQEYSETEDVYPATSEFNVIDNLPVGSGTFIVQTGPSAGYCSPGPCSATWTWTITITTANAPVWDESVDGDLGNGLGYRTNLGTLSAGSWDILGDLDDAGSFAGPDPVDTIEFTTSGAWTFDVASLNLGTATGQFFYLYDGSNQNLEALLVSSPTADIFGTYPAGTYRLSSVPLNNVGTLSYTHRINVESSGDEGLVSYWSFDDGTATDQAGTNNGSLVGGVSATGGGVDMAPIPGNSNALRFDGIQSELQVPNDPSLNFSAADSFTLSMWFMRESDRPIYHLLGKRDGCSLAINYQLARDFGLLHFNWPRVDSNVDPALGEWVHVASTYDATDPATARIYVDGELRGTVSPYALGPVVAADLKIGSSGTCPDDQRFQGVIDEVRIYNRALSAQEIAALAGAAGNEAPIANAGSDQNARVGDAVALDGTASFDDNTATADLIYEWNFNSLPPGSTATIANQDTANPSFVVDVAGSYEIGLTVTDEAGLSSVPDFVTVSSLNLAPSSDAGSDRLVVVGSTVTLDGSGSTDPESDPLTFDWSLATPTGSAAELTAPDSVSPSFVPDVPGIYIGTLTVSDAIGPGAPDSVAITAATSEDFAQTQIVTADADIAALPPQSVTTQGNQTAIGNFLSQATIAIQVGDVPEAIDKLEKALMRTDGCILNGAPDGNGPGRDWVTDCAEQAELYAILNAALEALR